MDIRAITVSVNYADVLAITLPRNARHFSECLIVTSPDDEDTKEVARSVRGVRIFETDAFFRHNAYFNKGLGMEEGFDALGRHGWILILDADILLPDRLDLSGVKEGHLHGALRRVLSDPSKWTPECNWITCPRFRDGGPIGFFQLFQADDPVLIDKRPWYNVNFPHAGGGDAEFLTHWPATHRKILPVDVLHLGPVDRNWFGRDQMNVDRMAAYVHRMKWFRAMRGNDPTAMTRVGDLVERVEVPGYPTSDFSMPFEQRMRRQQG